jgi:hypothetical protein
MQHSTYQAFGLPLSTPIVGSDGLVWNQHRHKCLAWSCRRSPESRPHNSTLTAYVQVTMPPFDGCFVAQDVVLIHDVTSMKKCGNGGFRRRWETLSSPATSISGGVHRPRQKTSGSSTQSKYRSEIFVPGRQDIAFPEGIPSERAQQSRQLERRSNCGTPRRVFLIN